MHNCDTLVDWTLYAKFGRACMRISEVNYSVATDLVSDQGQATTETTPKLGFFLETHYARTIAITSQDDCAGR
jgi:hypothetical protein